jgi:hypothetical protein
MMASNSVLGCFVESEGYLGSKLHRPTAPDGTLDETKGVAAYVGVRQIELRRIGNAERLSANLDAHALGNREPPKYPGIEIEESWPGIGITAHIAKDRARAANGSNRAEG